MSSRGTFLLHQRKHGTANEKWDFEGHFSFSNNVRQRDISHYYRREMGSAWTFLLRQRKHGTANEKWVFEGHFSFSNNVQQRDISIIRR